MPIEGASVHVAAHDGEAESPAFEYTQTADGIWVPPGPVVHREDEYPPGGFDILLRMQEQHFWYRGRHRFLLRAVRQALPRAAATGPRRAVDLGGGCGGWLRYLQQHAPGLFDELALADSSAGALALARPVIGAASCFQVDLMDLGWARRWEAAFALDVLEHLPDDVGAMRQMARALVPGGLLFVTMPALQFFWSYNDDFGGHQRRYTRADLARLADQTGLRLLTSRYFMFFLSPLLFLSRLRRPDLGSMTADQIQEHFARTHRVPKGPWNAVLGWIFAAETPLGLRLPFPWGTSVLGVFQKAGALP